MRHENGQSLLEAIVAVSVGILIVSALTFATIFSLRNANFAKTAVQATKLAQEGIERTRSGRDRSSTISISGTAVTSWDGSSITSCSGLTVKSDSIWCYPITQTSGCDNPPPAGDGGKCYFTVSDIGVLTNIGFDQLSIPSAAEPIPQTSPVFRRVVTLSDDSGTYTTQKTVTVIVTWTDFTGAHESRLTTILRKL